MELVVQNEAQNTDHWNFDQYTYLTLLILINMLHKTYYIN